jgi:hypothetical protein
MIVNVFKRVGILVLVLSAISAGSVAAADLGTSILGISIADIFNERPASVDLKVTIRDSVTGKRVFGNVTTISANGSAAEFRTNLYGRGASALETGRNDVYISATGYHPLKTYFILNNDLEVNIWLDPETTPVEMRSEVIESNLRDGQTLFHGHIYDAATGASVAGARVFIERNEGEAISDEKGYFKLYLRTPPIDPKGDMPAESDLVIVVDGVERHRRRNTLIEPGTSHIIVDLKPDAAETVDSTHKFRLSIEEQANTQTTPAESPFSQDLPESPGAVVVPASIRVGFSCASATTCTSVSVYSLDTYVRNGLNDEWIASWNANSLKAGAIAYRSYGAYHVNHPRTGTYDICSTTSCQVMDTDTHANSDSATAQTVGSVVVNAAATDFLFAEYSAENNLAPGCPDGNTGRPEHNWPCLADPVDAGQTYFGHGRGMCQWGSQRWSINQGKDFVWIVNHYYNANGNPSGLRTGVLQMGPDTLLPPPTLTGPGDITAPGTAISSLTPSFQWEPVPGADGYSLYVSKFNGATYDIVFNSETAVGQPITGTSYTLPAGILVADGQYRWNMSAHIPAGYGTPNTFRSYFTINPAATATVSGKVTTPNGLGLRNAVVTITDTEGIRRTATTSSFGLYSFSDVDTGETQTVSVTTKRYRFSPQVIQVNGNLSNVDFVGLE